VKRDNLKKGSIGELAAAEFLEKKGYKIVEMNYRTRFGEIDVIAWAPRNEGGNHSRSERSSRSWSVREKTLVFVEVKTKTGERFGEPWEMVDARKLGQIMRIAKMYLIKKKLGERLCRIDVVGVWLRIDESVEKVEHWECVT